MGTLHFLEVERGCWQFTTDDSTHYELRGDEISSHLEEGARLEVRVHDVRNMASTCMVGKIVEVLEVIHDEH